MAMSPRAKKNAARHRSSLFDIGEPPRVNHCRVTRQKNATEPALKGRPIEGFMTFAGIGPVAGTGSSLMGLAARPECVRPVGIARMGWAFPLRRCLAIRPCGFSYRSRARQISKVPPCCLSSSFAALQGLTQTSPAGSSRHRRLFGLSSPMTHSSGKVRSTRALPARHLPPSGFRYPRDGFLPRRPSLPCFVQAAPVGFALRSILLAGGWTTLLPIPPRLPLPADLASTNRGFTEAGI